MVTTTGQQGCLPGLSFRDDVTVHHLAVERFHAIRPHQMDIQHDVYEVQYVLRIYCTRLLLEGPGSSYSSLLAPFVKTVLPKRASSLQNKRTKPMTVDGRPSLIQLDLGFFSVYLPSLERVKSGKAGLSVSAPSAFLALPSLTSS